MGKKKDKSELYEYQYTTPNKKVVKELLPALKKPAKKNESGEKIFWGRLILIIGLFFVFGSLKSLFGGLLIPSLIKIVMFSGVSAFGYYQMYQGRENRKRLKRYYRYMKVLESRKFASIEELAGKVARKPRTVIKDLEIMMEKGWFLEGHLDAEGTQFMLTDKVYEQYQMAVKGRQMREEEERLKQEQERDPKLQEVNKVVLEGEAYIKQIHKLNDVILGDNISRQMDEIEGSLISIFELLKRKPEKLGDVKKLMQYYLPMIIKVLNTYRDFENERIPSEQLKEGKKDIEETLEKVQKAFVNLREKLLMEDVLDVSTDLDVLEAMMSRDGLMEEEFSFNK